MRRRRLAELVREEAGVLEGSPAKTASSKVEPAADRSSLPRYLTYIRKECRFEAEELNQLTSVLRQLKLDMKRRKKGGGKERFTENTLVRWSVRLFLTLLPEFREYIISSPELFGSQIRQRESILEILCKNNCNKQLEES